MMIQHNGGILRKQRNSLQYVVVNQNCFHTLYQTAGYGIIFLCIPSSEHFEGAVCRCAVFPKYRFIAVFL